MDIIYTFGTSKRPENGRRYLVQYENKATRKVEIASARWESESGLFEYDPCRFMGNATPQIVETKRYKILGWANVITDWKCSGGLMDRLCYCQEQDEVKESENAN